MLVLQTVPNGVSIARPPALTAPFASVWQTGQLPSAANCRTRALVAAEQPGVAGPAPGAIDRHGSTAEAVPIAAVHNATMVAATPRRVANGLCQLSVEAGA